MNNRIVPVLISLLLVFGTVGTCFEHSARANPIPFPTIIMPEEYINATISPGELGTARAEVDGLYPFKNMGYENVTMYYPVPPNSSEISVMMNDTSLGWRYSDKNYSTVVGEFPMIEWLIDPVPDSFEIKTHYSHPLPKDGCYSFLYAMGTGRYLESYAKETTAYVSINLSKDLANSQRDVNLYAIGYDGETRRWLWNPVDCNITQNDDARLISLVKTSEPFQPLVEDLLVRINPSGTVSYADNGLEVTMHVDKTIIIIGEVVNITLVIRNVGNDTLTLCFGSPQTFDVILLGTNIVAFWSDGWHYFLPVGGELQLQANQTFGEILQWNFFLYNRSLLESYIPPPPDVYTIFGICVGNLTISGVGRVIRDMESGLRIELVPPDINHDRRVDIIDIAVLARAFGSKLGDSRWNADADIQEDGTINILDIGIVAKSFGKTF
jgi:hypothetical protein